MQRFFVPSGNISKDTIIISDKAKLHHLKDVLRFKENDAVAVFDEFGFEYIAQLTKISWQSASLNIKEKHGFVSRGARITIACAIPKKAKMDDIVDKLTQLRVDRIIPLNTERVIIKLDKDKAKQRLLRWRKIALGASEQSQRNSVPIVDSITDIKDLFLSSAGFDLKLIPHLLGERRRLKEVLTHSPAKNILLLIGPEGDFTEKEVSLALEAGFIPVDLGDSVLRVDTAAIAAAAFIRLHEDR